MILRTVLRKKLLLSGCIRNDGQTQGRKKLQRDVLTGTNSCPGCIIHLVISEEQFEDFQLLVIQ